MTDTPKALLELVKADPRMKVEELVGRLSERQGIRVDQAAKTVYWLWQKGKITLQDPNPPSSMLRYVRSQYNLWFWLLVSMVALTTLSIYVFPQEAPYIYLRCVLGSFSVLYLPGSVLIEALYPKEEDLEPLERLALSIGLSLALVPLVGLVLNYTPWGIRLNPIFVALSHLTLALAAAAVVRKYGYFRMKVETTPMFGSEKRERLS